MNLRTTTIVLASLLFDGNLPAQESNRHELPSGEELARLPPDGGPDFNRLVFESSPYLLQHATNPVDWYPWGPEAFQRAKDEDKPIFLSIGYSTCHWCHVMERESFENADVAKLLSDRFVAVKVDREERPDIDAIYMSAVQSLTGHGGWPLTVFLTPDGKPIWGGTYFPPEDRFGAPGLPTVLTRVSELWKDRREELLAQADALLDEISRQRTAGERTELGLRTLERAFEQYLAGFDPSHGGFGRAPKFPRGHSLSFLLRQHSRTGDPRALEMVEATLTAMAAGGIHDHLGGGFHRYSTDGVWLVPHFEKMLYDQALLARTYLEAYAVTRNPSYARTARDIFLYVLTDLSLPTGGFASAEDADSEGEEGQFYLWTRQEILQVLGEEDGKFFADIHGVTEGGNCPQEASGALSGECVLHLPRPIEEVARERGADPEGLSSRLAGLAEKLLEARGRRVRPARDDKVLTDWNGLAIWALAFGGRVLDEPTYLESARVAAAFVLGSLRQEGRLLHRFRDGKAAIPAFLDDFAFLTLGMIELYQATLEPRWLAEAIQLAREAVRLLWDEESGGFLLAEKSEGGLVAVTKEAYDGATPSGNSAMTLALLWLGKLEDEGEFDRIARKNLEFFSSPVSATPIGYPFFLTALDFALGPTREVVLAGALGDPTLEAMRRAIHGQFLPNLVLVLHPTDEDASKIEEMVPRLKSLDAKGGKATAYVCENFACQEPATDLATLLEHLGKK